MAHLIFFESKRIKVPYPSAVCALASCLSMLVGGVVHILHDTKHSKVNRDECIWPSYEYTIIWPRGVTDSRYDTADFHTTLEAITELWDDDNLHIIDCCCAVGTGLGCN